PPVTRNGLRATSIVPVVLASSVPVRRTRVPEPVRRRRGLRGFAPCHDASPRHILEHDPEKWIPVFPRDKREAFARRSCSNRKIERDDDSKKSHHALIR